MTKEELIDELRGQLSDEQVLRGLLACPDCGRHIPFGAAYRLAEDSFCLEDWPERMNDYVDTLTSPEITGPLCQALARASAERRARNN